MSPKRLIRSFLRCFFACDVRVGKRFAVERRFRPGFEGILRVGRFRLGPVLRCALRIVHRFDENLEYTFLHSGSFIVELKATFVLDGDTIAYPAEGEKPATFSVSVKQSQLEMPNAFSPNGDSWNNTYRVKKHQSIVEFKATIFNRWGQKLYSWDDVNGEWDGKVNGKVVKDGVYFVNVVAKGADGRVYHIRKDINVLTRIESTGGDNGGTE